MERDDRVEAEETRWSRIRQRDYEYLVRRFWRMIERFVRPRLDSREEAEEVTQEFFLAFIEKDVLARVDERASFRQFLYHAARQFLIDHYRTRSAAKRGRDRVLALDPAHIGATEPALPGVEEFDRDFYLSLFNQARSSVKRRLQSRGRGVAYQAFRLFFFGDGSGERPSQARIAETLGLTPAQVRNDVHRVKRMFLDAIVGSIRRCAASEAEVRSELRDLVQFLATHLPDETAPDLFEDLEGPETPGEG